MIEANQLTHDYLVHDEENEQKKITALNQLSLVIEEGEFVAVLGHNGSGKSTLAKHINALLLPTDGHIYVDGLATEQADKLWEIRRLVGMVFQNPDNQIIGHSVEEDTAFGPENLGIDPLEIRKRVDEALLAVEMDDYKKQSPNRLSGGQKQRVAIAGTLAMKPKYIVLDEPTAMLDPAGRHEVMDTIQQLNQVEKMTIILITHNMEEAILADRVIVVDHGQIQLQGTPHEVFSKVEQLKAMKLDVPQVTELAYRLKKAGYPIDDYPLTIKEMAECLCRLK